MLNVKQTVFLRRPASGAVVTERRLSIGCAVRKSSSSDLCFLNQVGQPVHRRAARSSGNINQNPASHPEIHIFPDRSAVRPSRALPLSGQQSGTGLSAASAHFQSFVQLSESHMSSKFTARVPVVGFGAVWEAERHRDFHVNRILIRDAETLLWLDSGARTPRSSGSSGAGLGCSSGLMC